VPSALALQESIGHYTRAFAGPIYPAATNHSGIARIFPARWLRMFGRYSYTIYVIHLVVGSHVYWMMTVLPKRTGPAPYWRELIASGFVIALSSNERICLP
jgi:peptidoglycan/LPS O-acetylase OafA/YrhL